MFKLEQFTKLRRWYAFNLLLIETYKGILAVTFFVSSLIINAVQCILYFTLRLYNESSFRKINKYLMYSLMSEIVFVAEWWSGSDIKIYSSDAAFAKFGNESALIIMNHQGDTDWLMGWIAADRLNILGASKVFVKNILRYVPTIGWALGYSDNIFLKRDWKEDQNTFKTQIAKFVDYPYPIWMLLFCEGTRFTPEKHAASMQFAREKGIPEMKHLLLPRTRGFTECVRNMRGHFKAIYDVTIAFDTKDGIEPTIQNMFRRQKVVAEFHVTRTPLEEVPSDESESIEFLQNMYRSKDKLLDNYYNTGRFSDDPNSLRLQPCPRRYYSLVNMMCWQFVIFGIISFQYYSLLTTGSIFANCIAVGIIILVYFGLHKIIGLSKVSKAPKHGDKLS